uniref:tetrahydrofolate synthase n=1 Tax=Angiostrongylus cantonensis TaxID=6313 RepID=A0A0K0DI21_ANGCA
LQLFLHIFKSAILHLNSLQSNVELLQKLREKFQPIALDRLNVIHVSGTKGKGSTCAFVESILRGVGFRTGLYTSPHLVHVRERIRINGKPISEDLFSKYFFTVYNKLKKHEVEDGMPGYFKFLTLLAFHVFLEESVDVVIVEVGIGGEYDNTNIIQHPIVCGVTTLDIDHTSLLGSTLLEIAWHKAGIMKNGAPVIVSPSSEDVLSVMKSRALERGVSLPCSFYIFEISIYRCAMLSVIFLCKRKHITWDCGFAVIKGLNNWEVGEAFSVPATIVEAIESCNWRGRSQIVITDRVRYYLDGAHTPKSMEVCSNWYSEVVETTSTRKRALIFHCTADRDPSSLLPFLTVKKVHILSEISQLHTLPDKKSDVANFNQSAADQRARSDQCATTWKKIGTGVSVLMFDCITSAIQWVESLSDTENLDVLVTGSLHLVGGVLSLIEPSLE